MTPAESCNRLMSDQHGLITLDQALSRGLTPGRVRHLIQCGVWSSAGRGVYRAVAAPVGWRQRALAGCLSASSGAVASHLTGAALHGLIEDPPHRPDVIVAYGSSSRTSAALVHRARLHPIDRTAVDGIPVTSVARTLVDLAGPTPPRQLKQLVDAAMHRHRRVTARAVESAWVRSQRRAGRRGWGGLDAALADWRPEITPGSPAELRLLRRVVQWGFPEPERQISVLDARGQVIGRLDGGWRVVRVGLQYDSPQHHGPETWTAEEAQDTAYQAAGWLVVHVDKRDLRPGDDRLRRALDRAWARTARAAA